MESEFWLASSRETKCWNIWCRILVTPNWIYNFNYFVCPSQASRHPPLTHLYNLETAMTMKTAVFWNEMPLSCRSLSTIQWNNLPPSLVLMREAGGSFETSVNFYRTTWCYIPKVDHRSGMNLSHEWPFAVKKMTCSEITNIFRRHDSSSEGLGGCIIY